MSLRPPQKYIHIGCTWAQNDRSMVIWTGHFLARALILLQRISKESLWHFLLCIIFKADIVLSVCECQSKALFKIRASSTIRHCRGTLVPLLCTNWAQHRASEWAPAPSLSLHFRVSAFLQFSSVAQSCPTLCNPMDGSTPGLLVHHQLPEFTETHVH